MAELERTYTVEEVARHYRRGIVTIQRWVRQGRITAINTGGNRLGPYVFRQKDLDEFDERNLVGVATNHNRTVAGKGSVRKKTVTRKGR